MPGTTPNYLLPTMLGSDPLGTVAERITALATRLDGTAFTTIAPAAGFAGTVRWIRRSGIVTVTVNLTKASWVNNADLASALIPVGSRPADPIIGFGIDTAGTNALRAWYVDNGGNIKAAGAGTTSILGTVTYACVA